MIDKALSFTVDFINRQLKMTYGLNEDIAIISSLINPDGSVTENIQNKVVLSLINLEHETTTKYVGNYSTGGANEFGRKSPPVHLNMFLLVSANYDSGNYTEALKMLSSVINIFQSNTYFTKADHPDMEAPVEKLTFEIFNLPINEFSHIWSGIGAKYVPSILYKVRMITMDQQTIKEVIPGIAGLDGNPKANKN